MNTVIARLRQLSAAEEFFAELGVPFEQKVLDIHRLHILKRFNELLAAEDLAAEDRGGGDVAARCRACLERAYGAFAAAGAAAPKTLKLFRRAAPQVVPLSDLRRRT